MRSEVDGTGQVDLLHAVVTSGVVVVDESRNKIKLFIRTNKQYNENLEKAFI